VGEPEIGEVAEAETAPALHRLDIGAAGVPVIAKVDVVEEAVEAREEDEAVSVVEADVAGVEGSTRPRDLLDLHLRPPLLGTPNLPTIIQPIFLLYPAKSHLLVHLLNGQLFATEEY
jgi:hypothetical protein